jgi:hypothetical protein
MPNFVFYLIAGVIASFVMSIGRAFAHKYIPNFPDMPLLLSRIVDWGKPEPEKVARIMGRYLHHTTGALWGLLFGTLVDRQFFFAEFNIVQGVIFAIIPWLTMVLVLVPLVGRGFFGLKISAYWWLKSLVLHAVYGAVLGFMLSLFI